MTHTLALLITILRGLSPGPARADGISDDVLLANRIFNEMEEVFSLDRKKNLGVNFVVGNDLWSPGERFEDGDDWLALVCNLEGCAFQPAALSVKQEEWQGHYDDEPTAGQRLNFQAGAVHDGQVNGWFRKAAEFEWLSQGSVATYHSSMQPAGLLPDR